MRQPKKKKNVCNTTKDISKAYRTSYSQGEKDKITHRFGYECYFVEIFLPDKHKRFMENYVGIPGIVYNFINQNLITFKENLKYMCDLPIVVYFDYEITATTGNCLDLE